MRECGGRHAPAVRDRRIELRNLVLSARELQPAAFVTGCAHPEIRTLNLRNLNPTPLPVGLDGRARRRWGSNPHGHSHAPSVFKTAAARPTLGLLLLVRSHATRRGVAFRPYGLVRRAEKTAKVTSAEHLLEPAAVRPLEWRKPRVSYRLCFRTLGTGDTSVGVSSERRDLNPRHHFGRVRSLAAR